MSPTTPKLVTWRVSLIRKKLEYLGRVDASDREAAETIAVTEFGLTDEQRKRLVIDKLELTKMAP